MPETKPQPVRRFFTRRAIINAFQAHRHNHQPNPLGSRARSTFPLTLTVGLMTIGVILLISLLQLLTAYFS